MRATVIDESDNLTEAEWQRVAAVMAIADGRSADDYAHYLAEAKRIGVAVNEIFMIMHSRIIEKGIEPG